jgi:AcrR family transcriptional regulator
MSRPRSDEKRAAILEATTRAIVTEGLGAPTAGIAKEAGVANGSLFTYFETKTDLFNQLYLELKSEMASAAVEGFPENAELRKQLLHVWQNWTNWAVSFPEKRGALAQLSVSGEITEENRAAGHKLMSGLAKLVELSRASGPMKKVQLSFVLAIMNSVAEATMDFMTQDPENARRHSREGFDALWRMIT